MVVVMVAQNHYAPQKVPCPQRDGTAYWSIKPTGQAIVFVHGFRGHVTNTWQEFPSLLTASQDFAGHDLIFYTYDTINTAAYTSGSFFKQFLDRLFEDPISIWNQSLSPGAVRPKDLRYRSVVIVAHSLGAVVSRLALVSAHRDQKNWLLNTRLVLFAPAHCGSRVHALFMSTITPVPWIVPIAGLANYICVTLEDLTPNSKILTQLLEDTKQAQKDKSEASKRLLADLVIYGAEDKVIEALRFSNDPDPVPVPGKDHISVCKPSQDYSLPVHKLLEIL
jgi:pimeloyl-ACP methyl ester carboxylesterase